MINILLKLNSLFKNNYIFEIKLDNTQKLPHVFSYIYLFICNSSDNSKTLICYSS